MYEYSIYKKEITFAKRTLSVIKNTVKKLFYSMDFIITWGVIFLNTKLDFF